MWRVLPDHASGVGSERLDSSGKRNRGGNRRLTGIFCPKNLTGVPTLSSPERPGSPPPELLTYEDTSLFHVWEWHGRASAYPEGATSFVFVSVRKIRSCGNAGKGGKSQNPKAWKLAPGLRKSAP